jgi:hypothetical protein
MEVLIQAATNLVRSQVLSLVRSQVLSLDRSRVLSLVPLQALNQVLSLVPLQAHNQVLSLVRNQDLSLGHNPELSQVVTVIFSA